MDRTPFLQCRFILAGLVGLTLAGCATGTLRPLSSTPPRPKIVLAAPFTVHGWSGILPPIKFGVILPPGEYRPLYEDDQCYYYQAPSKLVVNDLVSLMYDGGIYVMRGTASPGGWYYIDEDGTQTSGRFATPPPLH